MNATGSRALGREARRTLRDLIAEKGYGLRDGQYAIRSEAFGA